MVLKNEKGMTLIEVIMSLLIVGLILVVYFVLLPNGLEAGKKASNTSIGLAAAERKVEELRGMSFQDLTDGTQNFEVADLLQGSGTVTVAPYPTAVSNNLKKVTVTISWKGTGRTSGQVKLSSLISFY